MRQFFGNGGSLALVPLSFFVIYKPKVVIAVSKGQYEKAKAAQDGAASGHGHASSKSSMSGSAEVTAFGLPFRRRNVTVESAASGGLAKHHRESMKARRGQKRLERSAQKAGTKIITLDSFSDVRASPMILGVKSQLFLRKGLS